MDKKVILIILDGWGIAQKGYEDRSAIIAAKTPFYDSILANNPNSTLVTFGPEVGLPEGQFGNSEVGHMNLGAGRTVKQSLVRLNDAIEQDTLRHEPVLVKAIKYAKDNNKPFHLMGLVSDGGVHAHINHVKALCNVLKDNGLEKVYIHAFTDGRDTDPKSGKGYIADLSSFLTTSVGKIASVTGRYYAMDRDNRWERIQKAYDVMVKGIGTATEDVLASISASYEAGVTDEFIDPLLVTENGVPVATIQEGDVVLCFNYRTDRPQEITKALTQEDFPENGMKKLDIQYYTLTNYNKSFTGINVIFDDSNLPATLGEVLSEAGKKQIRIAETEKYPHVTFFFSGGRNEEFEGESRILCNSPKVATYDLQPEMSVYEVRDSLVPALRDEKADFVCLNFANPDMVGHTGDFQAVVDACEAVDQSLEAVVTAGVEHGYSVIVLADHGNADYMINDDGSPNTQHSLNLVPCILIDKDKKAIKNGKLGDIAPTILDLMGIEKPAIMTGVSLV
ncbi:MULTISPECIES: 2,3-bisphosphoglycerate-independent phosphoglycerate mutase [unclassified Arcicella]|uniref:2,3-bisphosphoglycerate-independent phosphoglycerate mutase n=1 Tax=unclassified Arcicella TaxID=2644986 RepID=UPI002854ED2A|nr:MULTISPECIES: 2,3-bisphosphoglycerate-independent phosphoglycerate mutase [unclassified Arcicella]MDR6560691.1 2,3-bisphosphoglycerate-independent phosphoglycerate mutase [Arcicella sp. BE51]MDR6810575.1 2,3-bisphosphoglycerate-independent phosphoglycerate mutase [Arcicella sp. BE140]MDR6821925.1 2,3-bisphosphoglycerate-independent phosphoglycerate mutase [Arcicella sp. BE139]